MKNLRHLISSLLIPWFTSIGLAHADPPPADRAAPGSQLEAGMELVYASNGKRSDPWIVESVETGLEHTDMSGCTRIKFRYPDDPHPEIRWQCVSEKILYAFSEDTGRWHPARPIGPKMKLESRNQEGKIVARYETGELAYEVVDGVKVGVIQTTVYNFDGGGKLVRRLREYYATSLGTATRGIFEIPDPNRKGGWKKELEFELTGC